MHRSRVFREVRLLLERGVAGAAEVTPPVIVHGGDVAHKPVLKGERLVLVFRTAHAPECLVLAVHAYRVLVEVAPLPEGARTLLALVRPLDGYGGYDGDRVEQIFDVGFAAGLHRYYALCDLTIWFNSK